MVQKSFYSLVHHDITQQQTLAYPSHLCEALQASEGNERKTQEILTKHFKNDWSDKCERTLGLAKELGNVYTGSLYNGLVTLVCDEAVDLTGK